MASWEVITTHPQIYKEYDGFKLLGCSTNGAFTVINNKQPILKPEDFKGLRIRINNVMTKGMMEALGAVPLSFNVTDTYENIEKNIADGILMDWDYFYKNRFYEICPYAMDMGLCSTTTVILMNPDTYKKLPDDLKAVMDKYSGEYLVRLGGQMKEKANKEAIEGMKSKGAQLSPVSKELEEAMQKAEEAGFKAFIEEANKKGFDGQQIVDFASEVVAKWCKK
jgi:TRAP-type C4-dicarboxylate transport system substrate-binding protein